MPHSLFSEVTDVFGGRSDEGGGTSTRVLSHRRTQVLTGPRPGWVTATGDLDWASSSLLYQALTDVIDDRPPCAYLDVYDVRLMDASTVRVLLECRHAAIAAGGDLRVVGAAGVVRRVLELTDTWKLFSDGDREPD
jgi:anti-sigma B factor antagonist